MNPQEEEPEDFDIPCGRCEHLMDMFDEKATYHCVDEDDGCIEEGNIMFIEWKSEDCKKAYFFVCTDCTVISVMCRNCEEMCQFMGHMGITTSEKIYKRDAATKKQELLPANTQLLSKTKPRYDLSDEGKRNFNVEGWIPCGQKGDMPHFWKCNECNIEYAFSRK